MRLTRLLRGAGAVAGVFTAFTLFTTSPASAQTAEPSISVTPDINLVDFQTVTVTGSGFSPDLDIGMAMCTADAVTVEDCDLDTVGFAFTDEAGAFTSDYTVQRLIETPATGAVDCATVAGGCLVAAADVLTMTEIAGALVTFDPNVPPQPRLEVELTVDPVGTVAPKAGTGTVSGTVTCTLPTDVDLEGFAVQRAGRFNVEGHFHTHLSCDGSTTWTADLESFNGRFAGGKADVDVGAHAFDGQQFADDHVTTQIRLKGGR